MKVQMTYNGKTVEVEVADEQFEKLFAEKKTGYERSKKSESYWSIGYDGSITWLHDYHNDYDNKVHKNSNYFSDKSVAENMARAQRLWNLIHRRAVELCEPICVYKAGTIYQIVFMTSDNNIIPLPRVDTRSFGTVWFDTEEHCQQVIDEYHDELLWYFTEFKDRADM